MFATMVARQLPMTPTPLASPLATNDDPEPGSHPAYTQVAVAVTVKSSPERADLPKLATSGSTGEVAPSCRNQY
ncbi:hypothetical protein ACQP2U_33285 [Nocardia sp. CA-084685]|uniref:hypothetical protein n=1 Tax=Nocardia sp. CA-084685 TaxID=3239970 RepID=UPI003D969779